MSIPAIGALSPGTIAPQVPTVTSTPAAGGPSNGFAGALTGAVDNLQQLQSTSDAANVQAVTGNLNDIQDATVAAARVETTVELVSTLRNQAVDAFNKIMQMGS